MTDQDILRGSSADDDWDALARYVAGEGTPEERSTFRQKLEANPARAALVDALDGALRMPDPPAPTAAEVEAALASVLTQRVDTRTGPATRRAPVVSMATYRSRWQDARLRAAAAVLVVAGAGLLWRTMSSVPAGNPSAVAAVQFKTEVGKIDAYTLSDGSRVLLGPGSELTVAQGFGTSTRELDLKGEARFDVVHDSTRPFIVRTAAATFRDVGTVFGVHSDEAEGARVVVTTGAVAVEGKLGVTPVVLRAGDRATVARSGSVVVERSSATSDDMAWTSGKLVFRDASVEQVTADLRRWYGIELRVDSALASRTVTATFERSSGTDVGRIIAAMLGGGLREGGGMLHIVASPSPTPSR